jgi:hypothetical protein
MKIEQAPSVLKRDADTLGIDLNSAEYGYAVSPADLAATPEEAESIARELDETSQRNLESGVHHG